WPGSIRFRITSSPAINIAANARYGLHDASGHRYSIRFDLGLVEYTGMRTPALRFRCEYMRFTGASKPGTSRRYELVVGAQSPRSAGECASRPPMYHFAVCEISA